MAPESTECAQWVDSGRSAFDPLRTFACRPHLRVTWRPIYGPSVVNHDNVERMQRPIDANEPLLPLAPSIAVTIVLMIKASIRLVMTRRCARAFGRTCDVPHLYLRSLRV